MVILEKHTPENDEMGKRHFIYMMHTLLFTTSLIGTVSIGIRLVMLISKEISSVKHHEKTDLNFSILH